MPPERILVIRWKSIGDIVFTLPAVNRLRDNFPHAEITFLVSRENAFILQGFTAVNQVWTIDRAAVRSRRFLHGALAWTDRLLQIRSHRFDLVVDLQSYGETALISRWSGAPIRCGYDSRRLRSRAFTHTAAPARDVHPARQHLDLVTLPGFQPTPARYQFHLDEAATSKALEYLRRQGIDPSRPLVCLHPFTSREKKNWPLERFLELARVLAADGTQVLFGGGPPDRTALLAAGVPAHRIIDTDPLTYVAVLRQAHVVIGGDTGFLHLADAAGSNVILLGRAGLNPPFRNPAHSLLAPDAHLASIPLDRVLQQARSLLAPSHHQAP